MRIRIRACCMGLVIGAATFARGQAVLTGRLVQERFAGSGETIPLSAVLCFASPDGPGSQASAFRTWETHPAGWYRLGVAAGNHTVLFSTPAHFMRPIVITNVYVRAGDIVDRPLSPTADYAVYHEGAWDNKAASDYWQTFVAKGTSLTHVGFRLAHDGVDGAGPGKQNLLVSVLRKGQGTPEKWEQIGPSMLIPDVDSGGPKNYIWSAGWNSGQVTLTPGQQYAVHLKAEANGGKFQPFWRETQGNPESCYRLAAGQAGWVSQQMWMSVGSDGDGLLIPYNKRVHQQFVELTKFSKKWSQTYVANGKSLAGVILYAATSGVQPSMNHQRLAVRVRRGGADGPAVGIEKIAIGNGNFTGDASWGAFGAAYAPEEVPLEPGQTYAIEFESIENYETLHGYVNIKGMPSDNKPGFNPYRKHPSDPYEKGTAFLNGSQAMEYDLDMQVIEYEHQTKEWAKAVEGANLLKNGDMETGTQGWQRFALEAGTTFAELTDEDNKSRFVRVMEGPGEFKAVDGGFVQRAEGLSGLETYRLAGKVRCSWAIDDQRHCMVGYDPTGQVENARAATIVWTTLPRVHGLWVDYESQPIRPGKNGISVWLRARATGQGVGQFKGDFDGFDLKKLRTGAPEGQ